jgi:hypothetical protein
MALQSADLLEGDRDPTGRYAQLDLHVRRSLSDDLLWAALGVFGRARNGPSSRGAHAGFWLTARDGAPGAFARAELATQKLGREHAVGYFAVAGAFYPQTLGPTLQLVPLAQVVLRRADERGRGQPDADRTVYSPYAASRPHTVDLSLRLDHRPYVDTFLRTGVRARFSPGLVGTDRIDGFASAQLLAGTGLAPWLRFDALLSHRPESPQREHPFTRVAATPTVVFWHWLSDAQRIALEASASWFVDTPGKYGRESALSGQLQLAYDYSYLRGLEDYSLAERPFRARLEEGLPSRRRRTPITRSQWSHDHELP